MKKTGMQRKYRVWYRLKEDGSRSFDNKVIEIEAEKGTEARKLVENMYPGCKATSVWLIKK
ncbi:MAG: hypothetical protein ABF289_14280 [Clostridiales bacterium]